MKKILIASLLLCSLWATSLISRGALQTTDEFSTDYNTFTEQMTLLFESASDKKRAETFSQELSSFMQTGDASLKDDMIALCEKMRKMRARPFPDYQNCIKTYIMLDSCNNLRGGNLSEWKKVLETRASKRAALSGLNSLFKWTQSWLATGALVQTNAVRWTTLSPTSVSMQADGENFVINVPEGTLRCFAQGDSMDVVRTSGVFYTKDNKWVGNKGVITWERVGLPAGEVYAEFEKYDINMKTNTVSIGEADFVNNKYFKEKLRGMVEYKCVSRKTTNGARYPKFETLTGQRMEVKEMFPNVSYNGGFTQEGANFLGTGSSWLPAEVTIHHQDTILATFGSTSFQISDDVIYGGRTEVKINLLRDNITHPGVRFRFKQSTRTIELTRGNKGIEQSTYRDSYHKVNMEVELMKWNIDGSRIYMTMLPGAAQNTAYFESQGYYHDDYFGKLWGMSSVHPFQQIADFVRYNGGGGFPVRDFADYCGKSLQETQKLLLSFSYNGFVDYYVDRDVCRATDRLYDYLQFSIGKKDYDVLRFLSIDSTAKNPNGYIDLNSMNMHLNKVPGIIVSETKNVNLIPDSGNVILKRNRDFEFDGLVTVGLVSARGKDFYFSYDNYQLRLDSIEELKMQAVDSAHLDRYGQPSKVGVGNVLNDLSGIIQIDDPGNKSGKMNTTGYPRLNSTSPAKIYYDDPSIQGGRYPRETFYFTVDTFTFEDINNITNSNLPFHGVLTTGIFPDIEHDLVIREKDRSLGFSQESPEEGYPIYGGKAKFYNTVDLSNEGLRGFGEIEYLVSRSASKDAFVFLPDHAEGTTKQFDVAKITDKKPTYPGVELGRNQAIRDENNFEVPGQSWLEYYPEEDHLDVKNTIGKFKMFPTEKAETGFECEMDGMLQVTPSGLHGMGRTLLSSSTLESGILRFTDHTIQADTSYFASYTTENAETVLQSGELRRDIVYKKDRHIYNKVAGSIRRKYYNDGIQEDTIIARISRQEKSIARELLRRTQSSFIDFEKREGYFSFMASEGNEKEFATIKYKTMVKNYTWDIDRNAETIGQKGSEGNRFVCTKERGDSLNFLVPVATFDRNSNILRCEDVEFIDVADARVHLKKGDVVTIRKNAVMDAFDKTKVDVTTDSTSHSFTDAHVQIEGAKKYKGHGNYDFKDDMGASHNIFMGEIVAEDGITIASGIVSDDMPIDKYFAFKGKTIIDGRRQLLEFDGGAKMLHGAAHGPKDYVRFDAVLDPHKVRIPISARSFRTTEGKARNKQDETYRAFYIRKDSVHAYASFFESRKDVSDLIMLKAPDEGILYHNNIFERYELNTLAKIEKPDTVGAYMGFEEKSDAVVGFGQIGIYPTLSKRKNVSFDISGAGDIRHERATNTITMNIFGEMDFFVGPEVATLIYKDVLTKAPKCDTASYRYESRLREVYDTASIAIIKKRTAAYFDYNVAYLPSDGPMFSFDNLQLTWSTPKRSYVCDTTVNLMMMRYCKVARKVHVKAELLVKKGKGARMKMLMTLRDGTWYFFDYRLKSGDYHVGLLSSNPEVATIIESIPAKSRRDRTYDSDYGLAKESYLTYFNENFGLSHIPADPYAVLDDGDTTQTPEEEEPEEEAEPEEQQPEEEAAEPAAEAETPEEQPASE